MATDINFITSHPESITLYDTGMEQNIGASHFDWHFAELQTTQVPHNSRQLEPIPMFEMFRNEIPSQTENHYLCSDLASNVIESSNNNHSQIENPENGYDLYNDFNYNWTGRLKNDSDVLHTSSSISTNSLASNSIEYFKSPNSSIENDTSYRPLDAAQSDADSIKTENGDKNDKDNKCEVCFAKAGKHNYYGGNVCTSCRGFFRRSVQSKQYPLFVCNTNANNSMPITKLNLDSITKGMNLTSRLCKIDSKSRKSCKHCRFLRCISCGMRPGWVLSDEDRMRRLLQRNNKRTQLGVKRQISFHFTAEERQLVGRLKALIFAEAYSVYYQTFGEDLEIFRSYVNAIYHRQPIPYHIIKKIENIDKKAMIEKGFHLLDTTLDVSKIHSHLKQALVRHNYVALFGFYWAVFCEPCDMEEFMSEFMSYGLTHRNDPGVEPILHEMGKLSLRNKKSAWAYDMIYFSPWAPCAEIEERHQKLARRICMWPRMNSGATEEKKIDRSLLAILTMILLLSKDGIDLETSLENIVHLRAAEDNQIKFVMMLHRYLKDKYPDDEELVNTALANGLMIVSQAKELHEMHSLMLPI